MDIKEIIKELKLRLDKAYVSHANEVHSEQPDIRTKECSWGKIVAYSRAIKLLCELPSDGNDYNLEGIGIKATIDDMVKLEKRVRAAQEMESIWRDKYFSYINDNGIKFSVEQIKDAVSQQWVEDFGSLRDDSSERDGYFVLGFISSALEEKFKVSVTQKMK